jgi:hypothetical protein
MCYNGPELAIKLNYGKSVYKVCKDFIHHVFSRFGYIDMLCRPWPPKPSQEHDWKPASWMLTLPDNVAFQLDHGRVYRRVRADPLLCMSRQE